MPVLLDLDRAPALSELLKAVPGGLVQKVVPGSGAFADPAIAGLGSLTSAGPSEISFIVHAKYLPQMRVWCANIPICSMRGWPSGLNGRVSQRERLRSTRQP